MSGIAKIRQEAGTVVQQLAALKGLDLREDPEGTKLPYAISAVGDVVDAIKEFIINTSRTPGIGSYHIPEANTVRNGLRHASFRFTKNIIKDFIEVDRPLLQAIFEDISLERPLSQAALPKKYLEDRPIGQATVGYTNTKDYALILTRRVQYIHYAIQQCEKLQVIFKRYPFTSTDLFQAQACYGQFADAIVRIVQAENEEQKTAGTNLVKTVKGFQDLSLEGLASDRYSTGYTKELANRPNQTRLEKIVSIIKKQEFLSGLKALRTKLLKNYAGEEEFKPYELPTVPLPPPSSESSTLSSSSSSSSNTVTKHCLGNWIEVFGGQQNLNFKPLPPEKEPDSLFKAIAQGIQHLNTATNNRYEKYENAKEVREKCVSYALSVSDGSKEAIWFYDKIGTVMDSSYIAMAETEEENKEAPSGILDKEGIILCKALSIQLHIIEEAKDGNYYEYLVTSEGIKAFSNGREQEAAIYKDTQTIHILTNGTNFEFLKSKHLVKAESSGLDSKESDPATQQPTKKQRTEGVPESELEIPTPSPSEITQQATQSSSLSLSSSGTASTTSSSTSTTSAPTLTPPAGSTPTLNS